MPLHCQRQRCGKKKGRTVKIYIADKFSADCIKNELSAVRKELELVSGSSFTIDVQPASREDSEEVSENNGQIDLIKKIFKGEIVESRNVKENSDEY